MSDHSSVTVPTELQEQFPELIALILHSESMNDEERQYWINILPVMTPEQRTNLSKILQNEKEQLAAIDAKYAKEVSKADDEKSVEELASERRARRKQRSEKEYGAEAEEQEHEKEILEAIAELG